MQKKIGPAWTDRGRPAAGYYTKRTAQAWLDEVMLQARRGELPGMVETGATLADAVAEWLRYCEHDRAIKPSTLSEYRNTANRILRDLGDRRLEDVTTEMRERWKGTLPQSNRTVAKYIVILHGIFRRAMKVWGLPRNPAATSSARATACLTTSRRSRPRRCGRSSARLGRRRTPRCS